MHSSFALDLKSVRRRSGLTQSDCGQLLGVDQRRVSKLEAGEAMPTLREICGLSLIYGRSFESLFGPMFAAVRDEISDRLPLRSARRGRWIERFNRRRTLERLAKRIEAHRNFHD